MHCTYCENDTKMFYVFVLSYIKQMEGTDKYLMTGWDALNFLKFCRWNAGLAWFEMHCRKHCIVWWNMQCNYNAQQPAPAGIFRFCPHPLQWSLTEVTFICLFTGIPNAVISLSRTTNLPTSSPANMSFH